MRRLPMTRQGALGVRTPSRPVYPLAKRAEALCSESSGAGASSPSRSRVARVTTKLFAVHSLGTIPQQLKNRRQREPAALQEADLARLLAFVCGSFAEAATPQRHHRALIVDSAILDCAGDRLVVDATRLERSADRTPAVGAALVCNDGIREARIGEITERSELVQHAVDLRGIGVAARSELRPDFGARIFAAGEQRDSARFQRLWRAPAAARRVRGHPILRIAASDCLWIRGQAAET